MERTEAGVVHPGTTEFDRLRHDVDNVSLGFYPFDAFLRDHAKDSSIRLRKRTQKVGRAAHFTWVGRAWSPPFVTLTNAAFGRRPFPFA